MFQVKGFSKTELFVVTNKSIIEVLFSGSKESKELYLSVL